MSRPQSSSHTSCAAAAKAVEAAAIPVVLPADGKATLGKVLVSLDRGGAEWEMARMSSERSDSSGSCLATRTVTVTGSPPATRIQRSGLAIAGVLTGDLHVAQRVPAQPPATEAEDGFGEKRLRSPSEP